MRPTSTQVAFGGEGEGVDKGHTLTAGVQGSSHQNVGKNHGSIIGANLSGFHMLLLLPLLEKHLTLWGERGQQSIDYHARSLISLVVGIMTRRREFPV